MHTRFLYDGVARMRCEKAMKEYGRRTREKDKTHTQKETGLRTERTPEPYYIKERQNYPIFDNRERDNLVCSVCCQLIEMKMKRARRERASKSEMHTLDCHDVQKTRAHTDM